MQIESNFFLLKILMVMAMRIQRGIRVCEKNYLYTEKLISQNKKNPGMSECGHGAAGCSRRDWPGRLREWSFL